MFLLSVWSCTEHCHYIFLERRCIHQSLCAEYIVMLVGVAACKHGDTLYLRHSREVFFSFASILLRQSGRSKRSDLANTSGFFLWKTKTKSKTLPFYSFLFLFSPHNTVRLFWRGHNRESKSKLFCHLSILQTWKPIFRWGWMWWGLWVPWVVVVVLERGKGIIAFCSRPAKMEVQTGQFSWCQGE